MQTQKCTRHPSNKFEAFKSKLYINPTTILGQFTIDFLFSLNENRKQSLLYLLNNRCYKTSLNFFEKFGDNPPYPVQNYNTINLDTVRNVIFSQNKNGTISVTLYF